MAIPTPYPIMNQNAGQKWGGQPKCIAIDMPTSAASVVEDQDCFILFFTICNGTGAAVQVIIQDGQNPPLNLINQSLAPGGTVSGGAEYGLPMPGGITWSAAADGVHGRIVWVKPSIKP